MLSSPLSWERPRPTRLVGGRMSWGIERVFENMPREEEKRSAHQRGHHPKSTHPSSVSSFRTIPFSRSVRSFRPKIGHRHPYDVQTGGDDDVRQIITQPRNEE